MTNVSKRSEDINESITLKLNAKAVALAKEGQKVYNLTAGQLPYRPPKELVEAIRGELDFLKSFQYSPVAGDGELLEKLIDYVETSRSISFEDYDHRFAATVGNGGKHVLANIFAALVNPGDEVIVFAPYWISYPQMIKLNGGVIKVVEASIYNAFEPDLEKLKELLSDKTKAIILNSPNNPSGVFYNEKWMKSFAEIIKPFENTYVISDEIYYELNYYDPRPTYFYQYDRELLSRTIIVDGISKSLASTGLRLGYCIAHEDIISAIKKIQGHTASGSCSLIQRALLRYNLNQIDEYLSPVKKHLRENSLILREVLRENQLEKCWYQVTSAFYFLMDFSSAPIIEKFKKSEDDQTDYSVQICEQLLEEKGVAMVPSGDFGLPNCARMSLVLPKDDFRDAIIALSEFLTRE
ncbi:MULTISPECIES: pyridoxal phosphate-dependent aminotransferase [Halobacteriovorax]|uniref:Aminotransferase class I/II-fold pyridoxal phosphate-dependent enzyme n=1 Tax=Halobacteriovorax vibrionivorans TaxID=2152716 RepID=A0ABY0IIJ4_9BACT|nr:MULTISPECIES: aminotransferase class I/II-fold pyridoxal phosphate-dependent enzyme [Halobacteriovorax]AYF45353.1 aminotransferase, class I/II [Halobacteriovorax sp. BALOs_7]RZF22437.1 aminotransferase class I/II-fold pyridoxal phosphate-dependent enzyme [Halobacteriovorax vibrionivorans]TGD47628.1 aminotransferase class I/II-fold pyridoxal phosphate-dependent enzyme [Halobacteriovorax sp. Y22]